MKPRVVIIGAVAAGPKAGCRIRRLLPRARVTMIDRDPIISYGGCGIPYFVGGDVAEPEGLRTTSFHMVRDEAFFAGAKGLEVLTGFEATGIDRVQRTVTLNRVDGDETRTLEYDKLILATGTRPNIPPIPGSDLAGVLPVADLHQAQAIKDDIAKGLVGRAAVIGAGPTGLEMAEALADLWGVEVEVFEMADRILPGLVDPLTAKFLENHLAEQEVELHLGTRVEAFLADENGRVRAVQHSGSEAQVDLVILAAGVRPNDLLAKAAGLEVAQTGGIVVDEHLRTSDPDIYAGGDCAAVVDLLTGRRVCLASGSIANRQGRVMGTNIAAELSGNPPTASFKGVIGSWIMKLFELNAGKVGLTEEAARAAGFDPISALVIQADRAHFYPTHELMYLTLIADRSTKRVLGAQGLGPAGDALLARIDALAAILPHEPSLEEVANLELAYAPPFSAAMDILNAAANTVENLIDGLARMIGPEEFAELLNDPGHETVFLDVRAKANAKPYLEALADRGWTHLPQETLAGRLAEVPREIPVILICNSGARSYEAQRTLSEAGFTNTRNLEGGVAAVKKLGTRIIPDK